VPSAFEQNRFRPGGQPLNELLAQGALPLEAALRYATEIAAALREMHLEGRAHGTVDPEHAVVRSSGIVLLAPERRGYTDPLGDLTGFGLVLYAMLTGKKPSGDELRLIPAKPALIRGPAAVRAAAMRLAERCVTAERETAPDMQKVLTEVRLLHVMAKQFASEPLGLPLLAAPGPAHPVVLPPQPLEVYAGKAVPVINPPNLPPPSESEPADDGESVKPGLDAPQTVRARGSHSRPILKDVMCPKCKGFHVRLSRPRTRFERLLSLVGIGVHRCHRCFYRYIPLFGRKIVRRGGDTA
jgi:hypothetical protein